MPRWLSLPRIFGNRHDIRTIVMQTVSEITPETINESKTAPFLNCKVYALILSYALHRQPWLTSLFVTDFSKSYHLPRHNFYYDRFPLKNGKFLDNQNILVPEMRTEEFKVFAHSLKNCGTYPDPSETPYDSIFKDHIIVEIDGRFKLYYDQIDCQRSKVRRLTRNDMEARLNDPCFKGFLDRMQQSMPDHWIAEFEKKFPLELGAQLTKLTGNDVKRSRTNTPEKEMRLPYDRPPVAETQDFNNISEANILFLSGLNESDDTDVPEFDSEVIESQLDRQPTDSSMPLDITSDAVRLQLISSTQLSDKKTVGGREVEFSGPRDKVPKSTSLQNLIENPDEQGSFIIDNLCLVGFTPYDEPILNNSNLSLVFSDRLEKGKNKMILNHFIVGLENQDSISKLFSLEKGRIIKEDETRKLFRRLIGNYTNIRVTNRVVKTPFKTIRRWTLDDCSIGQIHNQFSSRTC
ncbi:hypothetical protein CANARDRAFT_134834 [[Candida] arabinofermentans NRRL YB-2248]|uniref:Uncharacterized protein n=1 Tax=[Candida] arabinofermentans NRRL YB-2248 TaxID=983967 RepID=A0A1E4T3Q8_9ASCO|nr:hypothetical protein CANARDRAFT_134834 [[Candida] arabinofermentans NRRL YB-2248]